MLPCMIYWVGSIAIHDVWCVGYVWDIFCIIHSSIITVNLAWNRRHDVVRVVDLLDNHSLADMVSLQSVYSCKAGWTRPSDDGACAAAWDRMHFSDMKTVHVPQQDRPECTSQPSLVSLPFSSCMNLTDLSLPLLQGFHTIAYYEKRIGRNCMLSKATHPRSYNQIQAVFQHAYGGPTCMWWSSTHLRSYT